MLFQEYLWVFSLSLPTRGAWIEIYKTVVDAVGAENVAPHTGSVD